MSLCPDCGVTLSSGLSSGGLCPACLLSLALVHTAADCQEDDEPEALPGAALLDKWFGPYRTLQILGEGGMGIVYLAEQQRPIRRQVALKVIKLGLNTREVIARFNSEHQTLVLMDHPNIARVFDAGISQNGQPYFVMEHVAGIPVNAYCNQHRLSNLDRIQIFLQICKAVQHAHQKGIIHRDLKPSNVLVGERDGLPFPQIIDFGIAKATDQHLAEFTAFTRLGQLLGTPEYMSPEQAEAGGRDVDISTDVYSLGVLLYELLAGALPFDAKQLREAGLSEFLRILREQDPPAPAIRLATLDNASEIAANRRTDISSLRRQLAGDLGWIMLKALEKDKARRYSSAADLAADIQRFLTHQPVIARPPSTAYQISKFTRRHKGLVLSVAAVFLVLLAGILASAWEAARARRAESAALAGLNRAERAERAARDETQKALTAEHRALLEQHHATSAEARASQSRDLATLASRESDNQLETALALDQFVQSLLSISDPAPNLKMLLDKAAARLAQNHFQPLVQAAVEQSIGNAYEHSGLYPDARKHLEVALAIRRRAMNNPDPSLPAAIRQSLRDEVTPLMLRSMNDLERVYFLEGRYPEAESLASELLDIQKTLHSEDIQTLQSMRLLAVIDSQQNKLPSAESLYSKAIEASGRIKGADLESENLMTNLADLYEQQGRYIEAEPLLKKVLNLRLNRAGTSDFTTALAMSGLGGLWLLEQRYPEAETLLRPALDIYRKTGTTPKWLLYTSESKLAETLAGEKKYSEAETLLLSSYAGMQQYATQPQYKSSQQTIAQAIVRLYQDSGHPEKAAEWQSRSPTQ